MRYQENYRLTRSSTKIKRMKHFLVPVFIICTLVCGVLIAGEMVPFVIPAKPNPDSLIAFTSFESVRTDSNRLQAQDGHFYRRGERVRLWGVNLSFGANLPRHEDAPYIAARLAAAGVNTVRCHHMDTARWPRGLWNAEDGKTISPEALDRLDFFLDQLARHGIYVNINLHVGRAHSEYMDLPKANRQYDKISNIFTPALIDAQKQFARQLLTHINPYRKVRYADDPAVAFVEITNENSFFMWASEDTLRTLPPYYSDILQEKFNVWLKNRYGSDKKLRRIWSEGAEKLGKNQLKNSNLQMTTPGKRLPTTWNLEQHSGCRASVSRQRYKSKNALCIEIDKADDTEWHLQFNQGGISVKAGQYYTVVFEAAADEPRKISCSVSQAHSPWSNLGLSRDVELGQNWQTFRFGFVAKSDDDNARLSFAFGTGKVPIRLANVRLHPGGRVSLLKGESIRSGSVAVFADNESPMRTLDRMQFLAETEKAYFDGMRNFIKEDLGCKALVTGTIVFGPLGLYTQSDMDFIDVHAYWQHPRFPGRPWDRGNWIVEQKPMTDYPAEATLFRLATARLSGKPFTLSEYNHPAPLDSQAECVPMATSFAAAQDWDAVWLYTYSHSSDDWYRENMNSYFDIDSNPAKWGFMRAGAAIFRDGLVQPLEGSMRAELDVRPDDLAPKLAQLHLKHDRNMMNVVSDVCGATRQSILSNKLFVSFRTYSHKFEMVG
ncbi:MAG: carbohydrate binding domain-containing protein [Planctomycetota bacterium]